MYQTSGTITTYPMSNIENPFTNILIIEIPFEFTTEYISKIKQEVLNPYIIFIVNPNLNEVKTTLITQK
jgi:guanylate kinase